MKVRMSTQSSFCDARRFSNYLEKQVEDVLSRKGFQGDYSCEARLMRDVSLERKDPFAYSFKLVVHGPQRLDEVVCSKGEGIGLAIRLGLKTLENRLSRRHDRRSDAQRHRIKTGRILATGLGTI